MRTSSRNSRFRRDASIMRVPRVAPAPCRVNALVAAAGGTYRATPWPRSRYSSRAPAPGSVLGGLLARAGHPVTLLGRAPHLDAIARDGLVIDGLFGEHRVRGLACVTDSRALARPFRVVFMTVKAFDTSAMAVEIAPRLAPDGVLVSMQNGLGNLEAARQAFVGRSFFAVTQAFFGISPALVYLVAGLQGTHGDLSAGTLVAFTTLQTRLLLPINQLLQVSVDVQSSLALFGRIFQLIDLQPRITDRPDVLDIDADDVRGEVALDHVSFRYGGGEDGGPMVPDVALLDVSLRVPPGQLAALVGPPERARPRSPT